MALLTECLITKFTRIQTLTPTYITGISAFITVYVKLFIQSALVKTQSLNINIYSYIRTIIFIAMYTLNIKSIVFEEMCYIQQCIRRQFFV